MNERPTITVEEAKRRRREREAAQRQARTAQEPPAHHDERAKPNGKLREIGLVGLHELGVIEQSDNMIAGILGEQQFGMVYGESGSGKSFLSFDMAAHYALGREWMGRKVKGGGVIYIAAEGRGGWPGRVEAWCRHHQLDEEARAMAPFAFILEAINLGRQGNGDVAAVIRAAERFAERMQQAASMIVVDTMARATPGSNENDAADMGAFVANMDAIREATKAALLVVHHSGKNATLGARGHSSLRGAVDLELEVERTDAGRVLRLRKNRDGTDGGEQAFELGVIDLGKDPDGNEITSCVVVPSTEPVPKRRAKPKKPDALALDYLHNTLVDAPVSHAVGNAYPQGVPITTVQKFREALERASIIDGETPSTRRQQWKRIKDKLIASGQLRIEGDYCWQPDPEAKA